MALDMMVKKACDLNGDGQISTEPEQTLYRNMRSLLPNLHLQIEENAAEDLLKGI